MKYAVDKFATSAELIEALPLDVIKRFAKLSYNDCWRMNAYLMLSPDGKFSASFHRDSYSDWDPVIAFGDCTYDIKNPACELEGYREYYDERTLRWEWEVEGYDSPLEAVWEQPKEVEKWLNIIEKSFQERKAKQNE